ncbi:hypothetical protein RHMOL_Rhmol02G0184700 [Rhododendron molle]|uniref:Uncharacterized protein n=1 Tax=Rhododendron molle TaxID=49168 RepID=A0ACC0PSY3_RHOML|nr:hypothetical protein RHMOL_Rhmol02G0184700 [Rhododendron molle]
MIYGTECWPIKKQQVSKMSVVEMRMLRWMCSKTSRDRIIHETEREMVGVAPIEEKLRENRLRWFGHIYRKPEYAIVKRADRIDLGSNATGRGRRKLTLDAVVRKDMSIMDIRFSHVFCTGFVSLYRHPSASQFSSKFTNRHSFYFIYNTSPYLTPLQHKSQTNDILVNRAIADSSALGNILCVAETVQTPIE